MAAEISPYEQERLDRIRRNRDVMKEMGIEESRARMAARPPGPAPKRPRRAPREEAEPERRSSRLANQPAIIYTTFEEDEEWGDDRVLRPAGGGAVGPRGRDLRDAPTTKQRPKGGASPPAEPAPGSVRSLDAQVATLQAEWLGRAVLPPEGSGSMKASVMSLLRTGDPHKKPPQFNKISEWRNCIALFVNVCPAGEDLGRYYDNNFARGCETMTFFGQSRQHEESPVVLRMLTTMKDGEGGGAGDGGRGGGAGGGGEGGSGEGGDEEQPPPPDPVEAVVLFCRRTGESYVYCGRVECESWAPGTRPLKFVWRLADIAALRGKADFRALMGSALDGE